MRVQGHISRSSFVDSNRPQRPKQSSKTSRRDSKAHWHAQKSFQQQDSRKEALRARLQQKLEGKQSCEKFQQIHHIFFISVLQQLATATV